MLPRRSELEAPFFLRRHFFNQLESRPDFSAVTTIKATNALTETVEIQIHHQTSGSLKMPRIAIQTSGLAK